MVLVRNNGIVCLGGGVVGGGGGGGGGNWPHVIISKEEVLQNYAGFPTHPMPPLSERRPYTQLYLHAHQTLTNNSLAPWLTALAYSLRSGYIQQITPIINSRRGSNLGQNQVLGRIHGVQHSRQLLNLRKFAYSAFP